MGEIFEDNLTHIRHHLPEGRIVIYAQDRTPPWPNPVVTQFFHKISRANYG